MRKERYRGGGEDEREMKKKKKSSSQEKTGEKKKRRNREIGPSEEGEGWHERVVRRVVEAAGRKAGKAGTLLPVTSVHNCTKEC